MQQHSVLTLAVTKYGPSHFSPKIIIDIEHLLTHISSGDTSSAHIGPRTLRSIAFPKNK